MEMSNMSINEIFERREQIEGENKELFDSSFDREL